eukprot:CAMPEP_0170560684 /NCGR_PEP_ID=MMETSP0211-20121228/50349_1 /TAXON_ID=311385 /ORGANISM="Pseudokeronopsis sp., Strain OXSARD2" /LENGTH=62 /DNA_ID=CAMNT_0010875197 /DNA_START=583 /DNA_END=767 /DNA_ORIENTATION=-
MREMLSDENKLNSIDTEDLRNENNVFLFAQPEAFRDESTESESNKDSRKTLRNATNDVRDYL